MASHWRMTIDAAKFNNVKSKLENIYVEYTPFSPDLKEKV
jgi:hypothetical protein